MNDLRPSSADIFYKMVAIQIELNTDINVQRYAKKMKWHLLLLKRKVDILLS